MKNLILSVLTLFAITTFATAATPATTVTEPVEEATFEAQSLAVTAFLSKHNISIKKKVNKGSEFNIYMTCGRAYTYDITIMFDLRVTLTDGTAITVPVVPTIYAGTTRSDVIFLASIPGNEADRIEMLNPVIIQPLEW